VQTIRVILVLHENFEDAVDDIGVDLLGAGEISDQLGDFVSRGKCQCLPGDNLPGFLQVSDRLVAAGGIVLGASPDNDRDPGW
jgi:hypothetical protein